MMAIIDYHADNFNSVNSLSALNYYGSKFGSEQEIIHGIAKFWSTVSQR